MLASMNHRNCSSVFDWRARFRPFQDALEGFLNRKLPDGLRSWKRAFSMNNSKKLPSELRDGEENDPIWIRCVFVDTENGGVKFCKVLFQGRYNDETGVENGTFIYRSNMVKLMIPLRLKTRRKLWLWSKIVVPGFPQFPDSRYISTTSLKYTGQYR